MHSPLCTSAPSLMQNLQIVNYFYDRSRICIAVTFVNLQPPNFIRKTRTNGPISPIPMPITNLPMRSTKGRSATARRTAPTVKTKLPSSIVGFRPNRSLINPATMEKMAAAPMVMLMIDSCQTEDRLNSSRRRTIAPETTPVSYPKRKPPIADRNVSEKRKHEVVCLFPETTEFWTSLASGSFCIVVVQCSMSTVPPFSNSWSEVASDARSSNNRVSDSVFESSSLSRGELISFDVTTPNDLLHDNVYKINRQRLYEKIDYTLTNDIDSIILF